MTIGTTGTTLVSSEFATATDSLRVERTGIRWFDLDRDRVQITIDVENRSSRRSQPTEMRIAAAPFGAFVPSQPLSTLAVPSIAPGDTARVSLVAQRSRVQPLSLDDATPEAIVERQRASSLALPLVNLVSRSPRLPVDLFELLRMPSPHWVGNFDVFVRGARVERHCGRGLRLQPNTTNLACFALGSRPDAYRCEIEAPASWRIQLRVPRAGQRFFDLPRHRPVLAGEWFEISGTSYVVAAITTSESESPAPSRVGLRVHERSSGKEALVELAFDAGNAASL
jgi:hypothetical protein